ncbi:hypothetical protein LAM01_14410 [Amylolactobacillus amylophilus]|nr:hypothetical protein LAM01_14410 [Amylolactobacillus amylophilus]
MKLIPVLTMSEPRNSQISFTGSLRVKIENSPQVKFNNHSILAYLAWFDKSSTKIKRDKHFEPILAAKRARIRVKMTIVF